MLTKPSLTPVWLHNAAYDNAFVATHNTRREKTDAQNSSDMAKIRIHATAADAKITIHRAGSAEEMR